MTFFRRKAFFAALLTVVLLPPWQSSVGQDLVADTSLVITNVAVLPMDTERLLENQTVVVVDGVISTIDAADEAITPTGIPQFNGRGLFLMPGLADLHVHILHKDELLNYLAWGVTTIMHLGGSGISGNEILAIRDEIVAGTLSGPNIYTTDRVLDGEPKLNSRSLQITDTATARHEVQRLKAQGFDFVKIYNNIDRPEFEAIVDEARAVGLPVIGHIPRKFSALDSLAGGQNAIAHTEELFFSYFDGPRSTDSGMPRQYNVDRTKTGPLLDTMLANNVATMPDLAFTFTNLLMWDDLDLLWNDAEYPYLHPATASMWQSGNINRRDKLENFILREQWKYELILDLTLQFQEAGVLQVVGTDASLPGLFPGKAVHRELTELVKAGLDNFAAIAIGTRNAGQFAQRYLEQNVRFGQIAPGYRADMVLLDANPLEDVRNARKVRAVVVNGRLLAKPDIEGRREQLRERYQFLHTANAQVDAALMLADFTTAIKNILSASPDDQELRDTIEGRINAAGYSYAFADDLDKAADILQSNTMLFPESANTWDSLAEIRLYMGDRDAALEYYRKALQLDPESDSAAQAIDNILSER